MEFFHFSLKRSLKWFWYLICQISFQRIFQSKKKSFSSPGNPDLRTVWYNLQFQYWKFLQFVETFLELIFQILESLQLPLRHDGHQPLRLQSIYQLSKIYIYRGSQIMDQSYICHTATVHRMTELILYLTIQFWHCCTLNCITQSSCYPINDESSTRARNPRNLTYCGKIASTIWADNLWSPIPFWTLCWLLKIYILIHFEGWFAKWIKIAEFDENGSKYGYNPKLTLGEIIVFWIWGIWIRGYWQRRAKMSWKWFPVRLQAIRTY